MKNKKNIKRLSLLLAFTVFAVLMSVCVFSLGDDVDFGGGDYGGGGGGDWGGGGYDYYDSDYSGDGSEMPPEVAVVIVVVMVIVFVYVFAKRKNGGAHIPAPSGVLRVDEQSLRKLKESDPKFSAADIEAKVKTWYMMFETAWCDGDMTPCRPFISDGLFNTYQKQLEMMKKNNEAARSEDIAVIACNLEKWTVDGDKEYLDVWMRVKTKTYKVDINNPDRVIKGDKQTTYHLDYRWQLMRSAGSLSDNAGIRIAECPNCGAQTSINQSGKCEYCGSTLSAESFDWVLNKVDKIAQTSHK